MSVRTEKDGSIFTVIDDALAGELRIGSAAVDEELYATVARFAGGAGRHGRFDDLA